MGGSKRDEFEGCPSSALRLVDVFAFIAAAWDAASTSLAAISASITSLIARRMHRAQDHEPVRRRGGRNRVLAIHDDHRRLAVYPRPFCASCAGTAVRCEETPGRGRVYSFTSLQRAQTPAFFAYVELDNVLVMLTIPIDCARHEIATADRVSATFAMASEGAA